MRKQFAQDWQQASEHPTTASAALEAVKTSAPHLGALYTAGLREVVVLHITEAVATYVSMLPTSRAVPAEAVIAIGKTFADLPEVRNLTLAELKTFMAFAFKRQAYGKLYGGFGYDTLLEWLQAYMAERTEAIVSYREQQHTAYTAGEKSRRNRQDGDAWGAQSLTEIYTPPTP